MIHFYEIPNCFGYLFHFSSTYMRAKTNNTSRYIFMMTSTNE